MSENIKLNGRMWQGTTYQQHGIGSTPLVVNGMTSAIEEIDGFNFGAVDDAISAIVFNSQIAECRQTHQNVFGLPAIQNKAN